MRKGMLGSIAALAAGAGTAWAQAPMPAPPAGGPPVVKTVGAQEPFGVPGTGGLDGPGGPSPVIMPPLGVGPQGDPHGIGPVGGFGPPPGPMYPTPGPYAQPLWQPGGPGGAGQDVPGIGAPRFWMRSEFLLWVPKAMPSAYPLLTTSAPSDAGLLGRPSTLVLAGGEEFSYDMSPGARFTFGFFGDADRRFGFETTGFFMSQRHNESTFVTSPTGIPVLARPFIDSLGRPVSSLVVGTPNFASGAATVDASTLSYSVEASGVWNLFRSAPGNPVQMSLDFLMGYRYFELREELRVESQSTLNVPDTITPLFVVGPNGTLTQVGTQITQVPTLFGGTQIFNPSTVTVVDSIRATNRFNGGQVGIRGEVRYGMFTFAGTGKLGLGHMHQTLQFDGNSGYTNAASGRAGGAFGGLLVNASNIGKYNNDEFAVMPEFIGNLGINVTKSVNVYLGYNFLYTNKVVRPGAQVNPVVNTAQVPFSTNYGALGRPNVSRVLFDQDDFWLMGINFGLQIRF